MDAMGKLAGGVAHDFNPLLTIITSYAELALDMVPKDTRVGSKIQEILLAAQRAAELTRQLLAVSRKQPHGETNFLQKPCSLNEFSLNLKIRSALSHGANPAEKQHNR